MVPIETILRMFIDMVKGLEHLPDDFGAFGWCSICYKKVLVLIEILFKVFPVYSASPTFIPTY